MTTLQQRAIDKIKKGYQEVCEDSDKTYCDFGLFTDDKGLNVVIIYTIIDGYNSEALPITKTIELVVFPDGKIAPLEKIVDDSNALALYIKKLKKIPNNG